MKKNMRVRRALLLSACCGLSMTAVAGGQTWTGSTAGTLDWTDTANWQGAVLPVGGSSAILNFFPDTISGPSAGDTVTAFNNLSDPFVLNVLNLNGTTIGSGTAATIVIANDRTGPNSAIGNGLQFEGASAAINFAPGYGTGAGTTYRITAPMRFQSDTTLTFSNTGGNLLLNNIFDGAGRLTVVNNAANRTVQFNGDQTLPGTFNPFYTGHVNVNKGVIELGKRSNIFGTNAGNTQTVRIANGAQVWINYNDAAYTQPQHFVLNGAASAANGAVGTAALRITGLSFGNGAVGGLAVASDSTLSLTHQIIGVGNPTARSVNVNQPVVGSGRLSLEGNSLLVMTKTSPAAGVTWDGVAYPMFSGNVDVPSGMGLQLNNQNHILGTNGGSSAIGGQTVNVAAGGSIIFNDGNGAYQSFQNFVLNGGGGYRTFANMELINVNSFGSGSGHQLGRLVLAAGDSTVNLSRNGAANAFNGLNVVGSIVGSGNLVKSGLAPLYFSAVSAPITVDGVSYSAFSGDITVNAGWLQLGRNSGILGPNGTNAAPGTQGVIVNSGATARLQPQNAAYVNNQVFVINGTGYTQTIGTTTTSYAALQLEDVNGFGGNGYAIGGLVVASNSTIALNRNAAAGAVSGLTLNGVIAGSGTLTKNGLAPLYINKTSTPLTIAGVSHGAFSGNVNVNAGTLQLGAANHILGENGTTAAPGVQAVTVANGASVVFNNNNAAYIANQNFVIAGPGYTQTIGAVTTTFATLQVNNINFGDHQIAGLGVSSDATLQATQNGAVDNPGRGLRINGGLAGVATLTKAGDAPVYLKSAAAPLGSLGAFSGLVSASAGKVVVDHADALGTGGLSIGNGSVVLTTGLPEAVSVSQVIFTGSGQLELNNNGLVIDYSSTSPLAGVRTAIINARNGGTWDGPGLTSSVVAASPTGLGIGYAEASELTSVPSIFGTVDASAVLVRPTLLGDTNLDGSVGFPDLLALARNYSGSTDQWSRGDFDYNGTVGFADLLALARNYGTSLSAAGAFVLNPNADFAADWALALSMVPEPATLALVSGISVLALRRSRSNRV